MGVTPARALVVAIGASLALGVLCTQAWAHVWVTEDLIGEVQAGSTNGTQVHSLLSIGDGTVLLLGALMTASLGLLGLIWPDTRRSAAATIAVAGAAMFAIATYDCVHFRGNAVPLFTEYRLTVAPYLTAACGALIALMGAVAAGIDQLPKQIGRIRIAPPAPSQIALLAVAVSGVLLAICGLVPWFNFDYFQFRGQETHVISSVGDGYVLAAIGIACTAEAVWLLRAGRMRAVGWLTLVATTGVAFGVAASALTYEGNLCASNSTVLGFMSGPSCTYQSGDVINSFGQGSATSFLWAATLLACAMLIIALFLPLLEGLPGKRRSEGDDVWA